MTKGKSYCFIISRHYLLSTFMYFFFRFGPRFFGLSNAYDKKWRKIAKNVAQSLNLQDRVKEGTLFDFDFFFALLVALTILFPKF